MLADRDHHLLLLAAPGFQQGSPGEFRTSVACARGTSVSGVPRSMATSSPWRNLLNGSRVVRSASSARALGDGGDADPTSLGVTDGRYELLISPTARRIITDQLPEAIAFAAYEFLIGPLLENPPTGRRAAATSAA
ncbi:MAG: hypothetical protein ABI047_10935 [Jatrophihabitantaceae bacterium]